MRINKYIAQATGLSRRVADKAVQQGHVRINGTPAQPGQEVTAKDTVTLNHKPVAPAPDVQTIILNKPPGYVVSRDGQGSKTVYDLLPPNLHHLKPVGRLDKDSSGLLLLTNDGQLANQLTHPKYQKTKIYEIELDKPLTPEDKAKIQNGVKVEDYVSRLQLAKTENGKQKTENCSWRVAMSQGRNRQIRHTFARLGYTVTRLHRTHFGPHTLGDLATAQHKPLEN